MLTNIVSVPSPGVLPGKYFVIVRTDVGNQVPELDEQNNLRASAAEMSSDVQEMALGISETSELANGQARYYRLRAGAGEWIVLELDCAVSAASTELMVRYGALPTRSQSDFSYSNPLQANQRIVLPSTQEGDYYVLAYGNFVPAPGSTAITLSARLSQFMVFDTSYGQGGNAGNLTFPINGADLDRTCTARLTNSAGLNRPALGHYYDSSTRFWATFDLLDLPPGSYTVVVQSGEGSTVTIPDSLEVVASGPPPPVVPVVTAPRAMRRNVAYTFTVQWANNSLNDAPAPLLTVGNTVPFGLDPSEYSLGTRYTFLGINTHGGPSGVLRPGQTELMIFHSYSGTDEGDYTAFADRVVKNGGDAMDWTRVLPVLPSGAQVREDFAAIWSHFKNQIGAHWSNYSGMLADNATLLPSGMGNNRVEGDLVRLEWQKALVEKTPSICGRVTSVSSAIDVSNLQVVANATNGLGSRVAWSLTDGQFFMPDLQRQCYSVKARSHQGRTIDPPVADIGGGKSERVIVAVDPGSALEVRIMDHLAVPISNALVVAGSPAEPTSVALSDRSGVARVVGLNGKVIPLFIRCSSHAPLLTNVTLIEGKTTNYQFALGEGARIMGIVSYSTNGPAAGATILLESSSEPAYFSSFGIAAADGSFALNNVAEGHYKLHVCADRAASATNHDLLVLKAPVVDLGGIVLPHGTFSPADGRPFGPRKSNLGCEDYVDGNRALAATLAAREKVALAEVQIISLTEGEEFASVVTNFLENCYPNMPTRNFTDGMDTVEKRRSGTGVMFNESSATYGFRDHPATLNIINSIRGSLGSALRRSVTIDTDMLCKKGYLSYPLSAIYNDRSNPFGLNYLGYIYGEGATDYESYAYGDRPDPPPVVPGPDGYEYYWTFGQTLVGGLGAHGMPHGIPNPVIPDKRSVSGEVLITPAGPERVRLTLHNVAFHIEDGFDFLPGDLGPIGQQLATRPLEQLEYWNWAYDIRVIVDWTMKDPVYAGTMRIPGFNPHGCKSCSDANPPPFCDRCDQSNPPDDCRRLPRPASVDPNDIAGPEGFGPEHWISPDQTFHYTVRFENDAQKALAPAQVVRITETLSTNLDVSTFRLGVMGFGTNLVDVPADSTFYQTRLNLTNTLGVLVDITAELDLARGELSWEFFSIDPVTGEQPFDPFLGFLPPNTDGLVGQGFVTYTVRPKTGVSHGEIVDAEARISFDYNEPIDTPRIFNTVDSTLPTSTVLALAATTNVSTFRVGWLGVDSYGGAGVGRFDVYVSDNGGQWKLWIQNTALLESVFTGECGHTYSFYSVAHDNAGNLEIKAAIPEAVVTTACVPPILHIRLTGEQIEISWPASPASYLLESTSDDYRLEEWHAVEELPFEQNGMKMLLIEPREQTEFYRLRRDW